jgi:SSS family solute:Na+ symporter
VIPPIGILGIIIGLYLRAYYPDLGANSAQALPIFFRLAFPAGIAALFSAGLLLVVLGTGAGLVLGVTTNLYMDGISKMPRMSAGMDPLRLIRTCTLGVVAASSAIVLTGLDSTILKWSYLSMGLRGASVFAGLFVVVFMGSLKESKAMQTVLYLMPLLYMLGAGLHS